MNPTSNIKAYVAGVVAVLLLLVLIPTGIHNFALQSKVEKLETDKTTLQAEAFIKRMEVTGLQNAIGEQNKKITELEQQTEVMKKQRQDALQQAAGQIQALAGQINRLQQDHGKSCTVAGIGSTILKEILP